MDGKKLSWETRRFNRFNELVADLHDLDEFADAKRREYVETPGGSIPRKLSGETMSKLIKQLNEEIPNDG